MQERHGEQKEYRLPVSVRLTKLEGGFRIDVVLTNMQQKTGSRTERLSKEQFTGAGGIRTLDWIEDGGIS